MKRLFLVLVLCLAGLAPAEAQLVRIQPQTQVVQLAGWTSSTTVNTTQVIYGPNDAGFGSVLVELVQGTTLTVGAITFEVSYDNTNWSAYPTATPSIFAVDGGFQTPVSLPYTLQASTNKTFLIVPMFQSVRIKLSTAITGSATVTPYVTFLPFDLVHPVTAFASASTFNATVFQATGTSLHTVLDSGTTTVTQGTYANLQAQTNTAEINGVTPLMNNGVSGTGSQRVNIASDNSAVSGFGVGATGSAVPANAVYGGGINHSGNLLGDIDCDQQVIYDASTNGSTQLVAISGSTHIYVCGFTLMAAGTVNVDLTTGTGSACASAVSGSPSTGTSGAAAKLTPAYQLIAQTGLVSMFPRGSVIDSGSANALCINTSAGVAVQALVFYAQR